MDTHTYIYISNRQTKKYHPICTQPIYIEVFLHDYTTGSKSFHDTVLMLHHLDKKRYTRIEQQVQPAPMTDHQRIHPVAADVEAPPLPPPTQPLQPLAPLRLEKGDTAHRQVPPQRTFAAMAPPVKPPKRSNCFCKCLCWTISLLFLLIIIFGAIAGILYLVFQPKLPNYSVDNLRVSDLTLNFDLSLSAKFNVRITAQNPNKKIGIYYEKGSHLSVWYKNTNLCQGSIPRFYQGHQNRTVLNVALAGQNQYGSTLLQALQEQQQTGRIPLDLKIDVPVRIKLGKMKLKKVRIQGTCKLIVDSLSTNSLISIKASTCSFGLKL